MASSISTNPSVRVGDLVRNSCGEEGHVVDVFVKVSFPDGLKTCGLKDLQMLQSQFGAPIKKRKVYECIHQFETEDDDDDTLHTMVDRFESQAALDEHLFAPDGATKGGGGGSTGICMGVCMGIPCIAAIIAALNSPSPGARPGGSEGHLQLGRQPNDVPTPRLPWP